MDLSGYRQLKWHQLSAAEMAGALVTLCKAIQTEQKQRKTGCRNAASRYEMRRLGGLNPGAYYRAGALASDGTDKLIWPYERSLANAAQAKLAGQQKPKVTFATTDADWSTKRKAKKLDRFVEGQFMQSIGVYGDVWQLMLRVFLDCCVFPTGGAVKIFCDEEEGRVSYERVFTWELYVDPTEARHGQPRNLFHVYPYDRDELIERFPEKAEELKRAPDYTEEDGSERVESSRVSNQIAVYEAWRLPFSKNKAGKHVIAIDGATLVDEEWTRTEFPFLWLRWSQHLCGFDSTSLIEEVASIVDVINSLAQRMEDSTRRTAMGVLVYEEGSVRDEDIRSNEDGINLRHKPGSAAPQYQQAQPFSPAHVQFLQMNVETMRDVAGISEMLSSGDRPAGLTAGVAIRAVEDVQSKRFSVIYRAYEDAFVGLARHTIACSREAAELDSSFASKWPGEKFVKSIRFDEVDLADDQYIIQLYSAPAIKNTPADRLQLIQELNGAGKISDESLIEVIKYLDTVSELDNVSRQRELIDSYIDEWLDATPESMESGEFRYRAPIPWMPSLPDALTQVAQAYLEAEMDRAPDFNKQFFLRFMEELDIQIQKKEARAAANAAGNPLPPQASLPAPPGSAPPPMPGPPMPGPGGPPPMPLPLAS